MMCISLPPFLDSYTLCDAVGTETDTVLTKILLVASTTYDELIGAIRVRYDCIELFPRSLSGLKMPELIQSEIT